MDNFFGQHTSSQPPTSDRPNHTVRLSAVVKNSTLNILNTSAGQCVTSGREPVTPPQVPPGQLPGQLDNLVLLRQLATLDLQFSLYSNKNILGHLATSDLLPAMLFPVAALGFPDFPVFTTRNRYLGFLCSGMSLFRLSCL